MTNLRNELIDIHKRQRLLKERATTFLVNFFTGLDAFEEPDILTSYILQSNYLRGTSASDMYEGVAKYVRGGNLIVTRMDIAQLDIEKAETVYVYFSDADERCDFCFQIPIAYLETNTESVAKDYLLVVAQTTIHMYKRALSHSWETEVRKAKERKDEVTERMGLMSTWEEKFVKGEESI